ncbi:YbjN domain-containing protein, partial [Georgenia sp. 10Sc9-8]|nr:YbjN domain-containing protein [Georgenia halotolerans]
MPGSTFPRLAPDVGSQDRDVVVPLTRDRVAGALAELDYPYVVDRAGDLGLLWAEAAFQVRLLPPRGTALQVQGRWHRRLAIERLTEVLELLDSWNREYVGPKCYA